MKKINCLIICSLLCLTISSFILLLFYKKSLSNISSLTAVISQNGKVVQTIDLEKVASSYTLVFQTEDGGSNTVEVSYRSIRIISSNCPDKLCVSHSYVTPGSPAVCLPHHFMIEVKGKCESSIDAYTH